MTDVDRFIEKFDKILGECLYYDYCSNCDKVREMSELLTLSFSVFEKYGMAAYYKEGSNDTFVFSDDNPDVMIIDNEEYRRHFNDFGDDPEIIGPFIRAAYQLICQNMSK